MENTLSVLADGKDASFLFLPDGEDPDDYVRKRGKTGFETAFRTRDTVVQFLLGELSIQHPPTSAEGPPHLVAPPGPFSPIDGPTFFRFKAAIRGLRGCLSRASQPPAR
jgi:DNA primase